MTTLAFDVYGTLIDTHGVVDLLTEFMGDEQAIGFSNRWRDKQLEYSFRLGLMRRYRDFSYCTKAALDFTDAEFTQKHGRALSPQQKSQLLEQYSKLPAFDDVSATLQKLQSSGFCCYAFSNGSAEAVVQLLDSANITQWFEGVISCKDIESFKPNPDVYQHFLNQASARAEDTWLISSNSFDVLGAAAAGWNTAWLRRSKAALFDPWEIQPTQTIASLAELKP
ncbi:haloacid dehalogenase type II [Pseudidiomarina aestuarii]|uniref:(S)-2-haloacid dehalogenase n=1 Tax=Pseudidiomarina aestuarii TaxID=624146 RepID=A0A7Z7EUE4_9GAMM|nr:haloacid dehalogenase type II [Pseudidiomarina aestuarii]RUO42052.1 haloacid dehalogenase type II [Pseudidiomarina aestuarii]